MFMVKMQHNMIAEQVIGEINLFLIVMKSLAS
jgi:hypothetical protein